MKKNLYHALAFTFIVSTGLLYDVKAQWTPTTTSTSVPISRQGNVGVGTNNPLDKLQVHATGGGIIRLSNETSSYVISQPVITGTIRSVATQWNSTATDINVNETSAIKFGYQADMHGKVRDAAIRFYTQEDGSGQTKERMSLVGGNVGIGIIPRDKLHVHALNGGVLRLSNETSTYATSQEVIMGTIKSVATQWNSNFSDLNLNETAAIRFGYRADVHGQVRDASIRFYSQEDGSGYTSLRMSLKGSRLGLGTDDPQFKLDVPGNGQIAMGYAYLDNVIDPDNGYIRSSFGSNVYWDAVNNLWQVRAIGANDFSAMLHLNNEGLAFITSASAANASRSFSNSQFMQLEKMRITANGNVGIGTTIPDAKLAVNGSIHTEEVRVDVDGAMVGDYVFDEKYNLLPLQEVEAYVKINKHLPEVPSAAEFEEKGMNLKEMNLLLLKKVEELTLHLIEMKKENEHQQQEIEVLKEKVK